MLEFSYLTKFSRSFLQKILPLDFFKGRNWKLKRFSKQTPCDDKLQFM